MTCNHTPKKIIEIKKLGHKNWKVTHISGRHIIIKYNALSNEKYSLLYTNPKANNVYAYGWRIGSWKNPSQALGLAIICLRKGLERYWATRMHL